MKKTILLTVAALFLSGFGLGAPAAAQGAPPPPPPPPPEAPEAGPGPDEAQPAPPPPRCGAYPAPRCARPLPRRPGPRMWHLGPYVGFGSGGFGILSAKGPYEYLSSGGFGNLYLGMNFTPRFALELAFIGSGHNEEFAAYYDDVYVGGAHSLMMWGVTLDAKLNLVRPTWHHRFIPYLQAGVGAYGLFSDSYAGAQDLARGGGFQAGGGVDIYVTRWLTLGARLLYRGIIMGELQTSCDGQCISRAEEDRTYINGLTGELNIAIVF